VNFTSLLFFYFFIFFFTFKPLCQNTKDLAVYYYYFVSPAQNEKQGRPGFVIGSPTMRKMPTGPTSTQAILARKCREYIDSVARLDPKLFDISDKFADPATHQPSGAIINNNSNSSSRDFGGNRDRSVPFNIQPAKYRFSVLRKRQGTTDWEDFAQYTSRDLTLFGEKVGESKIRLSRL
jgi:hypothetical protein